MYVYSTGEKAYIGNKSDTKPPGQSGDILVEIDKDLDVRKVYKYDGSGWVLQNTVDNYGAIGEDVHDTVDLSDIRASLGEKANQSSVTSSLALKADIVYVNSKTQGVSLSYKESYSSLSGLQTAYPTGDIYNHAVTSDGYIYTYYNNEWVSTGIQANGTGIANNSIEQKHTDFILVGKNLWIPKALSPYYSYNKQWANLGLEYQAMDTVTSSSIIGFECEPETTYTLTFLNMSVYKLVGQMDVKVQYWSAKTHLYTQYISRYSTSVNDNFYNEGLVNKVTFTTPVNCYYFDLEMHPYLFLEDVTTEERNYMQQLEVGNGTSTYEVYNFSLKNSVYTKKDYVDDADDALDDRISAIELVTDNFPNFDSRIDTLESTVTELGQVTNVFPYSVMKYEVKQKALPSVYGGSCTVTLLNEADATNVSNPTTKSATYNDNGTYKVSDFFNYFRMPAGVKGQTSPQFFYSKSDSTDYGTSGRGGFLNVGFAYDGASFDIRIFGVNNYRLLVNESDGWKYVNETSSSLGSNDGSIRYINFNFGTAKMREFIFETASEFGGIRYDSYYSLLPLPNDNIPLFVWTGSSITEGIAVTNFQQSAFPSVVSSKLGVETINVGVGATGYLKTVSENNRKKYRDRFATDIYPVNPDVIMIEGGINDESFAVADIQTEVASCINAIKTNLPKTLIIIIGSYFPSGSGYPTADNINAGIRSTAQSNAVSFIDLLKGEIVDKSGNILITMNQFIDNNRKNNYLNLGQDTTHLNLVGHKAMAEFVSIGILAILKSL